MHDFAQWHLIQQEFTFVTLVMHTFYLNHYVMYLVAVSMYACIYIWVSESMHYAYMLMCMLLPLPLFKCIKLCYYH